MNTKKLSAADARVRRPARFQVEMQFYSVDQMLPSDHQARIVWMFVESLDFTLLYEKIQVTDYKAGRSATAPEILVALWLLATLDGIGSARQLNRRCGTDIAY
jgi:transposase